MSSFSFGSICARGLGSVPGTRVWARLPASSTFVVNRSFHPQFALAIFFCWVVLRHRSRLAFRRESDNRCFAVVAILNATVHVFPLSLIKLGISLIVKRRRDRLNARLDTGLIHTPCCLPRLRKPRLSRRTSSRTIRLLRLRILSRPSPPGEESRTQNPCCRGRTNRTRHISTQVIIIKCKRKNPTRKKK